MKEIVAGEKQPPKGARKHCLYLNGLPEEYNILSKLQAGSSAAEQNRWKL